MNVSIGTRWEGSIEQTVKSGRYGPASGVVREGLRPLKNAGLPGTLSYARPDLRPDIRSFAFKGYAIFFR